MAIAEIDIADQQIARLHLAGKISFIFSHSQSGQLISILDLDVFDPNNLVNIKIFFLKNPGNPTL